MKKVYFNSISKFFQIKARISILKLDFKRFIWFQKRAWNNLFGKENIVDCRTVQSNGGFKYLQLELTKTPFSKTEVIN